MGVYGEREVVEPLAQALRERLDAVVTVFDQASLRYACWTSYFAGGGVQGGRVVGASDEIGGYPAERPTSPGEIVATIYHAMGVDPGTMVNNHLGQPRELVQAKPVLGLFK